MEFSNFNADLNLRSGRSVKIPLMNSKNQLENFKILQKDNDDR